MSTRAPRWRQRDRRGYLRASAEVKDNSVTNRNDEGVARARQRLLSITVLVIALLILNVHRGHVEEAGALLAREGGEEGSEGGGLSGVEHSEVMGPIAAGVNR